jgi:hypothetical protein
MPRGDGSCVTPPLDPRVSAIIGLPVLAW